MPAFPAPAACLAMLLPLLGLAPTRATAEDGVVRVPGDVSTIQAALEKVREGGIVEIADGVRSAPLRIVRPVHIRVVSGATVVVTAPADARCVDVEGTARVTIEGLRLEGGRTGIRVATSREVLIRRCDVSGFSSWGIALQSSTAQIEGCHVACPPGANGIGVDGGSDAGLLDDRVDGAPVVAVLVDRGSSARLERTELRGARRVESRGGVVAVVQRSSRASFLSCLVEGGEWGGVEIVAADATFAGSRILRNGRAGILAARGAEVSVSGGEVSGTVAGADPQGGTGILAGERCHVRLDTVRVEDNARVGLRVGPDARVEVADAVLRRNALGGILVEQEGLVDARRSVVEENGKHGVLALDRGEARLYDVTVRGTRRSGTVARGIEATGRGRVRVRGGAVEKNEEMGLAALDGGFLDVADGRVEANGAVGITVERASRARIRRTRVAGHSELGVAVREGSEVSLFDCELVTIGGAPVSVSKARLTASGNRYEGRGARAGERSRKPSLTLRPDGNDPLEGALLARRVGADAVVQRLRVAHARVEVEPGRYRLAAISRGGTREVPWGEVEVTDGEVPVRFDSGLRLLLSGSSTPRWRAYRLGDAEPLQEMVAGIATAAVPPGRYRVAVLEEGGTERRVGPEAGVEVRAGEIVEVSAARAACCEPLPITVAVPVSSWSATEPLRMHMAVASMPPDTVRARVYALDPRGLRIGLTGDAAALLPMSEVLGDRTIPLAADAPEGDYLVLVEAVETATGRSLAVASASLLRSTRPRLRVAAPGFVNPGERLLLVAAASGASRTVADLYVAVGAGETRRWLVSGGRGGASLVAGDRKEPFRRGVLLADGTTVLHDAPMPAAWAQGGDFRIEVSLVDAATGDSLTSAAAPVRSVTGRVPLRGALRFEGVPRRLAPGETATVSAIRVGTAGRSPRRVARVATDGTFSFGDMPAGEYALQATSVGAAGAPSEGATTRVEVGPAGVADAAVGTGAPATAAPAAGAAPSPPPPMEGTPAAPSANPPADSPGGADPGTPAAAAPGAPAGGCGDSPTEDPCPCGKLPVCVDAGYLAGGLSGDRPTDETSRGGWATWWLSKGREFALAIAIEKAVADALAAANPCLDVTSNEASIVALALKIQQRAKALEDSLRAVAGAEDIDRALEEHPEVARHLADGFLDLMLLDLEQQSCVARVRLDGRVTLGSIDVSYGVDSPGLPDGITENADGWDLEMGVPTPPPTTSPPVEHASASGSANGTDVSRIASDIARGVGPELGALAKALFCSCAEITTYCVVEKFADHIRGPGVFTENSCTSVQTCCGRVIARWTVAVIAPGTSGLFGGGTERVPMCCGRWEDVFPRDGDKGDPVFCDGGYTRESNDVDCDGLPNAEDPTPLGDDAPDLLRRNR